MFDTKYEFGRLFQWKHDLPLILLFIRAFYKQNFWKLQDLIADLSQINEFFSKQVFQSTESMLFEIRDSFSPHIKRWFGEEMTHYLNYSLLSAENYMQHTAVLSQLKKNRESLQKGIECFSHFKRIFLLMRKSMKRMLEIGLENL